MNDFSLSHYDYALPPELVAQTPAMPRDSARLLVSYPDGKMEHRVFNELPSLLRPGDLLVRNVSKVLPARLYGMRDTGGKREILLLRPTGDEGLDGRSWEALVRGEVKEGEILALPEGATVTAERKNDGSWQLRFADMAGGMTDYLQRHGMMPLPPYIEQKAEGASYDENERYQTTYAAALGSVAAPTAGLHFTPELDARLAQSGIAIAEITLHVGYGTFQGISAEDVRDHAMHAEWASVGDESAALINETKRNGGRVIAVGTTSLRTLETFTDETGVVHAGNKDISTYIYPGYRWKIIDGIITNFHVPKSSLLVLVESLVGAERRKAIYDAAIAQKYRFFSFGDASLLWK